MSSRSVIFAFLVVAAFFLSHSYTGVRHDGTLYLGQALVVVDPARMADDLFFLFGSQASFSVVPRIYAAAIQTFGAGDGTRLLMFVSLSFYLASAWWVVRALLPKHLVAIALVVVSVLSPVYGGQRLISYAEPFFTARSLAEPVILIGLGLLLRERTLVGLLFIGSALMLHPLLAIPAMLVAWVFLALQDRRWLWCAVLGVVPFILGVSGVAPFTDLFKTYDPQWLAVVEESNPFVFTLRWSFGDWSSVLADATLACMTARLFAAESPRFARLAIATAVIALLGVVASTLFADILSNVLLTGLQLWRCDWLLHWTATIALTPLVWKLWSDRTGQRRAAALLFVAGMLSFGSFAPLLFAAIAATLVLVRKRIEVSTLVVRALMFLCFGLVFVLAVRQAVALTAFFQQLGGTAAVQIARPISITLVLLTVVALGMRYLPRYRAIGVVAAGLLVALSIASWDQREDWIRYQENYVVDHGLLWADIVKPAERLYWFREVRAPWLMMRHANYYSPNQAAGVLFNRQTALEIDSRAKASAILDLQETVCRLMNTLNKQEASCEPDVQAISDVCVNADRLSYIVIESLLATMPAGALRTGFNTTGFERTFYLYRCSDIIRTAAATPTATAR